MMGKWLGKAFVRSRFPLIIRHPGTWQCPGKVAKSTLDFESSPNHLDHSSISQTSDSVAPQNRSLLSFSLLLLGNGRH